MQNAKRRSSRSCRLLEPGDEKPSELVDQEVHSSDEQRHAGHDSGTEDRSEGAHQDPSTGAGRLDYRLVRLLEREEEVGHHAYKNSEEYPVVDRPGDAH